MIVVLFARTIALAFVLLTTGGVAFAQQPSIVLQVDRQQVTLTDEFQLVVTLRGNVDGLQPPALTDFDIVGQPRSEQRIVNRSQSFSQIYTLRAKKVGKFTIGPAHATANGQVVASAEPITITVVEAKAQTPVSADEALTIDPNTAETTFLRWSVPRTKFYVGEPFPLTLNLWIRTELNASSPELVTQPKFDGLLVEDLKVDTARSGERRTLGQNTYDVYPLTAQLATPLRSGKVLIEATTLRLAVSQGGFLSTGRRTTLTSPSFHIDILEVPTEGRPAGFSPRNVGQFTLTAKIVDERGAEATRARTGQRLILRAEVSGAGNLVSLEAPQIIEAANSKSFVLTPLQGANADSVAKSPQGMSGTRVFQWIVSANQPGNLTTPTLKVETFDPVAERFVTLSVPGRSLEVSGAVITPEADQATSLGEDVGPIVEVAALESSPAPALPRSPIYWGAMALPLLGFAWVELRHRKGQKDAKNPGARASRGAGQNAKKRLRAAEQALKDGLVKDFYGQLARTLTSYFEERANIPATGMTHSEVRHAARAAGYPAELADAWVVEMENCDFARFAPTGSAADKMREAIARTSGLIDRLETITPERRP